MGGNKDTNNCTFHSTRTHHSKTQKLMPCLVNRKNVEPMSVNLENGQESILYNRLYSSPVIKSASDALTAWNIRKHGIIYNIIYMFRIGFTYINACLCSTIQKFLTSK
ncbi:hypothetical protein Barb6XT_02409 [Bacteroidales bacterium Barb6XT]|nr:hypothetical protein Barb6XT_02409 [Bacteroidales bacterium Barb6XT]